MCQSLIYIWAHSKCLCSSIFAKIIYCSYANYEYMGIVQSSPTELIWFDIYSTCYSSYILLHLGQMFIKIMYLTRQRQCMLFSHGLINYIDTKEKCRHLKKLTCKGTLRQVFICLRPPFLLGFCLGWSSNYVGSKSGQIYRVLNSCRLWSSTGLNTPHPLPATHCLYVLYFDTGKGGAGES